MSDLRMNNTRGYLAEFLVHLAVGGSAARVEWDAFDVKASDGTRIEVKAGAYLQAWPQRTPSRITFSGLTGRTWTPLIGYSAERTYNTDVYVFCVQTATTHAEYRPLDVARWDFYVLPASTVMATGARSIGIARVSVLAGGSTSFADLAQAIATAAQTTSG